MAQRPPTRRSFRWPGRARSAEIERAAERAAERGLARLRERQRRWRAPMPPAEPGEWPSPPDPPALDPWAEPPPDPPAPDPRAEPPDDESQRAPAKPVLPGHLWEEEFDALADELVSELRRDLGPERDREGS